MNKVILFGRVASAPQFDNKNIHGVERLLCKFSLEVKRPTGNGEDGIDIITCQAWGNVANVMRNYGNVGRMLMLDGMLRTNPQTSKNGTTYQNLSVTASYVEFVPQDSYGQRSYPQQGYQQYQPDGYIPF